MLLILSCCDDALHILPIVPHLTQLTGFQLKFILHSEGRFGCTLGLEFRRGCRSRHFRRAAQHSTRGAADRHRERATGAADAGVCPPQGGPRMPFANAARGRTHSAERVSVIYVIR